MLSGAVPEVGRWLWVLQDAHRRAKDAIARADRAVLDRAPRKQGSNKLDTLTQSGRFMRVFVRTRREPCLTT
jgi:hypothetical protein